MHGFKGERTLMRIFIGESDRCAEGPYRGRPLYDALVHVLRAHGCAGATVLRGIQGYGASARVHTTKVIELSLDLPIVVEVVETEEKIQELLPVLDTMIGGGMVTLERVRVILYRPADFAEGDRWAHRIEGLEAPDEAGG
jgi:PII-like signaling protein